MPPVALRVEACRSRGSGCRGRTRTSSACRGSTARRSAAGTAGGALESCACSASVWPRPNRLFCEICACAMKFSTDEKPAPIWNVPVGRSVTSTLTSTNSSERAALGRDVDVLEEAERHDAALRDLEVRLVEQLALGDPHLAADHLVARLRVAADVDALEVGALAARDLEGQRRSVRLSGRPSSAAGRSRRRSLVLVVGRQLLAVLGDHRARELHRPARMRDLARGSRRRRRSGRP